MIETSVLLTIIGTFVTCEEACYNHWNGVLKFFKWRKIKKKKWNSDEPVVQSCLEEFKCSNASEFSYSILSECEINDIAEKFIQEKGYDKTLNWYCKLKLKKNVVSILKSFNEYINSVMTEGEKTIHTDMNKGFKKIGEKLDAISEDRIDEVWDVVLQKLNDANCNASDFGTYIVGKCHSYFEIVVMMFPNIDFEKKEKYQKLFNQCYLESKSINPWEVVVSVLSKNFEGYADRHKGLNGFYYSSEFVNVLKKSNVKPRGSVNLNSIVESIVADLKKWYRWENENALSEYVEFFLDVLTDEQIVKLAEPYAEIFIDDYRQECSPYNPREIFKNKEIAKIIVEKNKGIVNGKKDAVYPALKHYLPSKKWNDETNVDFRKRMWRKYGSKLQVLDVDENEFMQIPM